MNLSICIITKNEEQNIDRCLKALAPYGLETIVVDTGSTDRSKQIAARYTDRLYDFPWCDDFSAAKNFAIEKASHSYVLVLDSDEFVEAGSVRAGKTDCRASGGGRPDPQAECVSQKRGGAGEPGVDQPHIRKRIFSLRGQDP